LKDQEVFLDFFTIEDGTDRLCRNVGMELPPLGCVISQKSAGITYMAAEA